MNHLVWDWNGTLLDDLDLTIDATNDSLRALGAAPVTVEQHRRLFRRPLIDYYGHMLGRQVTPAEFAVIDEVFYLRYHSGLVSCPLAADALAAMDVWSDRSGTHSVLSMWSHRNLIPELRRRGLLERLSRADGRADDAEQDTKATYLRRHLERLGVSSASCVLIGDTVDDAAAAAAVGAGCVLYTGGITDAAVLRTTGYPVVSSLLDAVRIAGTPAPRALSDAARRPGEDPAS